MPTKKIKKEPKSIWFQVSWEETVNVGTYGASEKEVLKKYQNRDRKNVRITGGG